MKMRFFKKIETILKILSLKFHSLKFHSLKFHSLKFHLPGQMTDDEIRQKITVWAFLRSPTGRRIQHKWGRI